MGNVHTPDLCQGPTEAASTRSDSLGVQERYSYTKGQH